MQLWKIPVDNAYWIAGAPLGVLDRTPSRGDDVAINGGQACAGKNNGCISASLQ